MSDLLIDALKAQVADLRLARKQANDLVIQLMQRTLPDTQREQLFAQIVNHMKEQELSCSAQLIGVLRTTLVGLNHMAQTTTDSRTKHDLVETIKSLNIVLENK